LVQIKQDYPDVIFLVKNPGHIESQELSRIFDRFYRIPSLDPWRHGGTGLGLALVKHLLKKLNGGITVTSAAGWITFEVRIPQAL
jgi:signal transduction histidine kinase